MRRAAARGSRRCRCSRTGRPRSRGRRRTAASSRPMAREVTMLNLDFLAEHGLQWWIVRLSFKARGEEEQGREGLQQAQAPPERLLRLHVDKLCHLEHFS
ncbi:uncharacterized protein LOC123449569 isoform X2 [Hordeum vulgare subsp. vulgare]|uniref:Predicted protein n=1 Tax=Hordeum vulgare subsp. vulgare TaxID=112509 RepID=F2CUX8_HORVV|nr:uncharacterized protein LOC123449569 isoform X2 [Hordeum vulgare subsp. vulgare]BAJ86649.1 predicted protein [Hordeum vulgare subsp. vulgare]